MSVFQAGIGRAQYAALLRGAREIFERHGTVAEAVALVSA